MSVRAGIDGAILWFMPVRIFIRRIMWFRVIRVWQGPTRMTRETQSGTNRHEPEDNSVYSDTDRREATLSISVREDVPTQIDSGLDVSS